MRVCVISFGTNWWAMHSSDTSNPYCFRRRAAYFNAAALMCGRRLRHSAIYPGQIRFNAKSGDLCWNHSPPHENHLSLEPFRRIMSRIGSFSLP